MTQQLARIEDAHAPMVLRDTSDLALRFVVPLDELRLQLAQLEEFKRDIMVPDVDYGVIPGTNKPTLLKPGAEKLSLAFGLSPVFTVTNKVEDWDRGFFHYEVTCDLYSKRTGERVANGIGSANSKESRYRWRDAKPACPDCNFELRRSKKRDGDVGDPGWYCWTKVGGCGATWPKETVKVVGRIENPEPFELVNTLMKMGEKRSLVASVLIATGGSGIWTQDLEDMPSVTAEPPAAPFRERDVIDVPPRPAPAPATNGKASLVTRDDDPMWQRWLELKGDAEKMGADVPFLRLPIERTALQSAGINARKAKDARVAQLAKEDADRAAGAAEHDKPAEDQDDTGYDADLAQALALNATLLEDARQIGVKGLGPLTAKPDWPLHKVRDANTELEARSRSRNSDIDTRAAAQEQAF